MSSFSILVAVLYNCLKWMQRMWNGWLKPTSIPKLHSSSIEWNKIATFCAHCMAGNARKNKTERNYEQNTVLYKTKWQLHTLADRSVSTKPNQVISQRTKTVVSSIVCVCNVRILCLCTECCMLHSNGSSKLCRMLRIRW